MNTGDVGRRKLGNGDPVKYDQAKVELMGRAHDTPGYDTDFAYHPVTSAEAENMAIVREEILELALLMSGLLGNCREMSVAKTKLEEAMMWFNAGVARKGR